MKSGCWYWTTRRATLCGEVQEPLMVGDKCRPCLRRAYADDDRVVPREVAGREHRVVEELDVDP